MARLAVRLTPRAASERIDGFDAAGVLRVRVTAPPVDGKANHALIRLLANQLDVPARDIAIVSGASSRSKVVNVDGLSEDDLRARLGPLT